MVEGLFPDHSMAYSICALGLAWHATADERGHRGVVGCREELEEGDGSCWFSLGRSA